MAQSVVKRGSVVLIRYPFTDLTGAKVHPVLVLTPIDNQRCAIEAMRAGAFNYLVKTTDYLELVPHAVTEALKRFNEGDEMKRTIVVVGDEKWTTNAVVSHP